MSATLVTTQLLPPSQLGCSELIHATTFYLIIIASVRRSGGKTVI
ncbi:hypothetical protein [Levilactobacillus fujinensis]